MPLLLLIVGTAVAFVVGCPGIILHPNAVFRDVTFEANHVKMGHGEVFVDTLPGFIYHIVFNLRFALTPLLLLFCLVAVGVAIARRRPADALIAAYALPYYILIGLAQAKFARYTLPLFPPLFLLLGGAWSGWKNLKAQQLMQIATVLAGIVALGFSVALDQNMMQPDPRDEAAAYIRSLPDVHSVGFAAGPWSYSPTLSPMLAHPMPPIAQLAAASPDLVPRLIPAQGMKVDTTDGIEKLLPIEWYTPLITGPDAPDAVTFGELHYTDWLRARAPEAETYLTEAEKRYPHHKDFTKPVALFGIPLLPVQHQPQEWWHGLPSLGMPHDMLYVNQSVSVWTK